MKDVRDKLIVALDVPGKTEAREVFKKLKGEVTNLKIGLELFTKEGVSIVEEAVAEEFQVFLDLKFHDIPNTVAKAIRQAAGLGIFMTNVHCLGGTEMMKEARLALNDAAKDKSKKPLLIGVTVLTSHNEETFSDDLKVEGGIPDSVLRLAKLAKKAGLDGVVASPQEIKLIRENLGNDFKIITPGIRPSWAGRQDQKRVMTPREAIQLGADYIVVGRPILGAKRRGKCWKK